VSGDCTDDVRPRETSRRTESWAIDGLGAIPFRLEIGSGYRDPLHIPDKRFDTMPTAHIAAAPDAFAKTVLLPGDPLRAQHIAATFFSDAEQVT
jgi:hypothetical protein